MTLDLTHLETLLAAATPGPWEKTHDIRYGSSGNKHADQWWISSPTRKDMALMEVWDLTKEAWLDQEKATEQNKTIQEVMANSELITALRNAAPALIARVRELEAEKDHWEMLQQEGGEG